MKHSKQIRAMVLSAMFLALGLVLPFFTGQIPQIGGMLLPMHIPAFLCGLICGWQFGVVVGFIMPLLRWRWGMIWSRASRNKTPIQKRVTAGRNAHFPNSADRSMAGISRLQMDAAVMTPAAKPVRPRWIPSDKSLLRKNTHAAPKVVPRKGSSRP